MGQSSRLVALIRLKVIGNIMFIEYKLYDSETDTITRGLGTFTGIDYDTEWKLVTINFIDNNNIVFQLDASSYSDLFLSIKKSMLNNDNIFELSYVCVMDDDSIDCIESALKDAYVCTTIF